MLDKIKKLKQDRDRLNLPIIVKNVVSKHIYKSVGNAFKDIELELKEILNHNEVRIETNMYDNSTKIFIKNIIFDVKW